MTPRRLDWSCQLRRGVWASIPSGFSLYSVRRFATVSVSACLRALAAGAPEDRHTAKPASVRAAFSFIGYLLSSWGRRGARVQLLLRHLRGRREQERLTLPLALSQA